MLIAGRVVAGFIVVAVAGVVSVLQQRHVHAVVVAALRALRRTGEIHRTVVADVVHVLNSHVVRTVRFADAGTVCI